jgi:uncharacterized protein (TIGR00369 family)
MPSAITPHRYDADTAPAMTTLAEGVDGLPSYLGIRTTEVEPATMLAELDVRPELLNPFGTLHGGVVSALVDHVLGAVLYPVIERGHWAATTEFKLNLLTAVREGTVRARSTIVSLTRRTAVVQVEVDNDGRPCALAQGTVLIVEPRGT